MHTIIQGFLVSGGLIIAIGAQNAFVLKQGLRCWHVLPIVLTCFFCDFLLISVGVFGLGALISQSRTASVALAFVGALFLFVYGAQAWRSAWRGGEALVVDSDGTQGGVWQAVLLTLAITLLNPHVYLDTVVIIGGIAGTLSPLARGLFLLGAVSASALWFFALGYGARLLIPLFRRPVTWRLLDVVIGLVMWGIAYGLVSYGISLL
ncbi:LysE/ArgO family amino acid transporter [Cardiobacterium valvarum]|uniref:Arginine exporter protein ArgO n=1 Tax=Cardiobacterium valvarum TaxID=194702 RepID=A0A381E5L6_9GAMM|nr:LysE/ArgO family amino acid transporter [Cardiobacterium valvarum]SUX21772.1 Arginine exporter protein ArgO [Cardiobacterium valvarum]